jgi:hypothetical protein
VFRTDHVIPNPKTRLLDQACEVMRIKHYSLRTERTYWDWIKRFIFFHQKRHPWEMAAGEVGAVLSGPAVRQHAQVLGELNGREALARGWRVIPPRAPRNCGSFWRWGL